MFQYINIYSYYYFFKILDQELELCSAKTIPLCNPSKELQTLSKETKRQNLSQLSQLSFEELEGTNLNTFLWSFSETKKKKMPQNSFHTNISKISCSNV